MNSHKHFRNIQLSVKAQTSLLEAQLKRSQSSWICYVLSGIALFITVLTVNLGIFFHLSEETVWRNAAFYLSAFNLVLAVVPYLFSIKFRQPSQEERLVKEIRDMSLHQAGEGIRQEMGTFSALNLFGAATGGPKSLAALLPFFQMAFNELSKRRKE